MALEEAKALKTLHSSSMESFPTEMIVNILSRLPVKSLLRCKSVCKSWRYLISDPYFIKYHLNVSTTNRHYSHHHLLVSSSVPAKNMRTCPLYDVLYDENSINPLELDSKHPYASVLIIGSCNGLMCIATEQDNLFIWNPSTRKSIQLPYPPCYDGFKSHGFGYNESSDDYNVVKIASSYVRGIVNIVMIYSSKKGKWKRIGGFPHRIRWIDPNVFLKGALHWIATKVGGSLVILSLDLAKETYGEVMPPMAVDQKDGIDLKLGILGDCLCVLYDYSRNARLFCADVWVMKVYGVKHSWFKLVSIPYHLETGFLQFHCNEQFLAPLCVTDDGKVLVQIGRRLIMVDSKKGSVSEFPKLNDLCEACTFVESLVSPGTSRSRKLNLIS